LCDSSTWTIGDLTDTLSDQTGD